MFASAQSRMKLVRKAKKEKEKKLKFMTHTFRTDASEPFHNNQLRVVESQITSLFYDKYN